MNIKNLEFLKDGLKYLGFGEKLNADLEKNISQQPAEFKLSLVGEFNKDTVKEKVNFSIDFRKSDQSDMYFLNRYQATLTNDDPAREKSQTFYINKNSGITAKEAYNLLSGRAVNKDLVNKEGKEFNAWVQLDFQEKDKNDNFKVKHYTQGYGYDLDAAIKRYPIKGLENDEERTKLIKALEKGNLQQVTFAKDGKDEKMFVEANPQYKSLNVYDHKLEKVFQGIDKKEKPNATDKSVEKSETIKQDVDDDGPGKKQSKRKGVNI